MAMNNLPALVTRDLVVSQGADCSWVWRYREESVPPTTPTPPADFETWDAVMEIRQGPGGKLWGTLSKGSGITLDSEGYVTVELLGAETQEWNNCRAGQYDILLLGSSGRIRLSMGKVVFSPAITVTGIP